MLSWILSWVKGREIRHLKIITLASKARLEKGEYALSFDVMKSIDYDTITEKRRKEDKVYEELSCIEGTCSGDIEMELSAKKCSFDITVSGALKSAIDLEHREGTLEYNDSLTENRRYLYLSPTYDEASEGRAAIKFWYRKMVIHTVIIWDVPVLKMSPARMSTHNADAPVTPQTFRKGVDSVDSTTIDSGPTGSTLVTATVKASGSPMLPANNQALPVNPNSSIGPTSICFTSSDGDEVPDEFSGGETAYDKILSHSSLLCLAGKLPPQDSEKILILLHVEPETIEQKKKDHTGDIVSAMSSCFRIWRGDKKKSGEANLHTNKLLYEDLLKQLKAIGRNDIRSSIIKVLAANRELERGDF